MDTAPKCCRPDCPNLVAHAEQETDGHVHVVFFCVTHVQWGVSWLRPGYPGHAGFCPDACRKLLAEHGCTFVEQCLDCAQVSTYLAEQQQHCAGGFTRRDLSGNVIEWCCQKMATTDLARAIRESARRT